MKINRHNYEEFFILYLDKELNEADRLMVESFIELHPDLREELELLSQFRLQPETDITFSDKELLLRPENGTGVSTEQMLLYLDGELSPEESRKTEDLVFSNAEMTRQFAWLQKTKLEAEEISFGDKSILYRKAAPTRIIAFSWQRIAAAVIILLLAGAVFVLLNNRDRSDEPVIVKTKPAVPAMQQDHTTRSPENQIAKENSESLNPSPAEEEKTDHRPVNTPDNKETLLVRNVMPVTVQEDPQAVKEEQTNNLPEPINNRNTAIAYNDPTPSTVIKDADLTTGNVTSVSPQPLNFAKTTVEEPVYAEESTDGKNKLRGLFRKVTRTLEKRTNIDATDNEDRLLVAGLSIKL